MNQTKKYLFLKRSVLKRFLSIFSLSAAAFAFQACYGPPGGLESAHIEGYVKAEGTDKPLEGIKVTLDSLDTDTTNADGSFWFNVSVHDKYSIQFTDIDDTLHGHFKQKVVELDNKNYSTYLTSEVTLERY